MNEQIQKLLSDIRDKNRADIKRTPTPGCWACQDKRLHTDEERKMFHSHTEKPT